MTTLAILVWHNNCQRNRPFDTHVAGRMLLNYQAAPVVYAVIIVLALLIGRRKYSGLQVGK